MKLPIKTRILEWAIDRNALFTAKEVSEALGKEYNGEKTTTVKNIEKQLDMYCRVGFLDVKETELNDKNELFVTYEITEEGKTRSKYIPGRGNKLF